MIPEEKYAFVPKSDSDEIAFLKGVCMIAERENGYYIHHFATQLYDAQNGIFTRVTIANGAATIGNSDIKKIMVLFSSFILPGLYWQAHHALHQPLTEIYDNSALISYMLGIEEEWINLNNILAVNE
jgi:hypothetical protein